MATKTPNRRTTVNTGKGNAGSDQVEPTRSPTDFDNSPTQEEQAAVTGQASPQVVLDLDTVFSDEPPPDEPTLEVEAPKRRKRRTKAQISADKKTPPGLDPEAIADQAIKTLEISVTMTLSVDGEMNALERGLIRPGLIRLAARLEPEVIERIANGVDIGALGIGGIAYASRIAREKKASAAPNPPKESDTRQDQPVGRFREFVP